MNKILSIVKSESWIGYKTNDLAWTVGITLSIVIAPAILAHTSTNQLVTGTIVNTLLFLAAYKMPLVNAMIIAAIPSTVALLRGLLPAPMAILIPYIIISNVVLVSCFSALKKSPVLGVITASLAKFLLLYSIIFIVAGQLNAQIVSMFQWPQLITALIGGFLFINILKFFEIKD